MRNPLEPVVLGPVLVGDVEVVLRPGRPSDAAEWRRIRLRDEALIAPYWATDELSWRERHTDEEWLRQLIEHRDAARAGHAVSFVIEAGGRLGGEVGLTNVAADRHSAELGIWSDRAQGRRHLGAIAGAMVIDYGFEVLGLQRLSAPSSTDNRPAAIAARRFGMVPEARMASAMSVGGRRLDHDLWTIRRGEDPPTVLCRTLGINAERTTDAVMPVSPAGQVPRLLASRRGAAVLARHRLGLLRHRAAELRSVRRQPAPDGPVTLRHVDAFHGTATLTVDIDGAADPTSLVDAVTPMLDHAFREIGLSRVSATCLVTDSERTALFAAAGLRHEGVLHDYVDLDGRRGDHDLWAITETHLMGPDARAS